MIFNAANYSGLYVRFYVYEVEVQKSLARTASSKTKTSVCVGTQEKLDDFCTVQG